MSDSEDDVPLRLRAKDATAANGSSSDGPVKMDVDGDVGNGKPEINGDASDSDSDVPLSSHRKRPAYASSAKKSNGVSNGKHPRVIESDSSDDEVPLAKKIKAPNGKTATPMKKVKTEEESPVAKKRKAASESNSTPAKKSRATAAKKEAPKKTKAKAKVKEEENDDEPEEEAGPARQEWWHKKIDSDVEDDKEDRDGSVKWDTLQHSGPLFAPPYVPHGVKMKYDGKPVDLEPEAEEVATFFAEILGTQYAENPTFCKNFFEDFLGVLSQCKKKTSIKVFEKCDFTPIHEHVQKNREIKKNRSKEEKEEEKRAKQEVDKVYGTAYLNGQPQKVGNYRIEPPGLFRGRGNHPKTGKLKKRVLPEQVTINIGPDAEVPKAPEGHKWKSVVHDNEVTWLATWKENINGAVKYVFLAATSSLKGMSDLEKFEKARELDKHAHTIRHDYTMKLKDEKTVTRQLATALYFIDRLALRAGHEKGEDEADTVGCCSLRFEHIALEPPNRVTFDFLGKDSIRYENTVEVDAQVFKNLKIFKKPPKGEGDMLFDRLTPTQLNKYLTTHMKGLTAKVFRTYNASSTFSRELKKTPFDATVNEKVLEYNRANRRVAILCNHQRSVSAKHHETVGKIEDKIKALKHLRYLVKKESLKRDPSRKKKEPERKVESDFEEDSKVKEYVKGVKDRRIEACNLVREAEGLQPLKNFADVEKWEEKRYDEGMAAWEKVKKEKEDSGEKVTKPRDLKKPPGRPEDEVAAMSDKQLDSKLKTLNEQIHRQKLLVTDKEENKTTSLSTSKVNYIDPRITFAWCLAYDVPPTAVFNKSLRDKFAWAEGMINAKWEKYWEEQEKSGKIKVTKAERAAWEEDKKKRADKFKREMEDWKREQEELEGKGKGKEGKAKKAPENKVVFPPWYRYKEAPEKWFWEF